MKVVFLFPRRVTIFFNIFFTNCIYFVCGACFFQMRLFKTLDKKPNYVTKIKVNVKSIAMTCL